VVYVAQTVETGNFDKWAKGPSLPQPRADAGVAFLGGSIYVVGGYDETGKPTSTTYVLTPDLQSGDLGQWKTATADTKIDLPEKRGGGSLVALADGLLFVGGSSDQGPSDATWKAKLDSKGALGEWTPQAKLLAPTTDAVAVLNGDYVWVYGGKSGNAPVATVQRGTIESKAGDQQGQLVQWAGNQGANLPQPRANAAGFISNGALYLVGGNDGTNTRGELYWATPSAGGNGDQITEWKHLPASDLPSAGLEGGSAASIGPNVVIVGGKSGNAVQTTSARSNTAPGEPFFQLGLVGATVPALKVEGEIGQQLGYLNAAGAGTVDFIILIIIGWAFAHKERTRTFFSRFRRGRPTR
ncbi:MAG: Kelch repeat-containing protein, partial [Chloroflexota bacterium]